MHGKHNNAKQENNIKNNTNIKIHKQKTNETKHYQTTNTAIKHNNKHTIQNT